VLGPLLFLIFINDIVKNSQNTLRLFADDALLYGLADTTAQQRSIQNDLSTLSEWSHNCQMQFNAKKCQVIRFQLRSSQLAIDPFCYRLDNSVLDYVPEIKYLGVTITASLDWTRHIEITARKAFGVLDIVVEISSIKSH
jgi:hypothetical protein